MKSNQKQESIMVKDMDIDRENPGLKRNISQIGNTITFEFKKNLKAFIIILIVFTSVFSLLLLISELQLAQDVALPSDSITYVENYLTQFFGLLIIISASLFGGSIIAEDFQKQTGNLLFPKISKTRLLIGRLILRYTLNAICVSFYYVLISIVTLIPITLWASLVWALLYTFAMLTFVTFMSSIMRSTSATIISCILILLIGFQMITMILTFAGLTIEPFYLLTYYEGIITGSLSMPNPRYIEISMPTPGGGELITFTQWLTPTEPAALIGMLIYISIFLVSAYFIYHRRQSKSE